MGKRAAPGMSKEQLVASVARNLQSGDANEYTPLLLQCLRGGDTVWCNGVPETVTDFEYTDWRRSGVIVTHRGRRDWSELLLHPRWAHVFYQPGLWEETQCVGLGHRLAVQLGLPARPNKNSGRMQEFAMFKLPPVKPYLLRDAKTGELFDLGTYARGAHGRSMCDPFCRKEGGRFVVLRDDSVSVSSIGQTRFSMSMERMDAWVRTHSDMLRKSMKQMPEASSTALCTERATFLLDAVP